MLIAGICVESGSVDVVSSEASSNANTCSVCVVLIREAGATTKAEVEILEFGDSTTLQNLGALLLQEGPVDAVAFEDQKKIRNLVMSLEKHNTEEESSLNLSTPSFPRALPKKRERVYEILSRVLGHTFDRKIVGESNLTLSAAGCAFEAAEEFFDASTEFAFVAGNRKRTCLRMDTVAADAVHLFPPPSKRTPSVKRKAPGDDGDEEPTSRRRATRGSGSLFEVLDHCRTKVGSDELAKWLRRPLVDIKQIRRRQAIVKTLVNQCDARAALRECLGKGVPPNLKRLAQNLSSPDNNTCTLVDLHKLHQFTSQTLVEVSTTLAKSLEEEEAGDDEDYEILKKDFVYPLTKAVHDFKPFNDMVEVSIDLEFLPEILLKPSVDDALVSLRRELVDARGNIHKAHAAAAQIFADQVSGTKFDSSKPEKWPLKLDRDKQRGYVLRSPKIYDEKSLAGATEKSKKENPIFEVLTFLKNGVYLTTSKLAKYATHYQEIQDSYLKEQAKVTTEIMKAAATYAPLLEKTRHLIATIDVYAALAHAAVFADGGTYVCPTLVDDENNPRLSIKNARHPTVETSVDSFIANDYDLGGHDDPLLAIITGPNMGGKSTYIRGLGALVVMAQIGSFLPCDSAEMTVFDAILARVGANDNMHAGVSTFMAEMIDASTIVHLATPKSLVLIDELGRGTSTSDGFGLAWAISDYLARQSQCLCLFATHFHELTDLAREKDETTGKNIAKNLHVTAEATQDDITFLYDVEAGPSGKSFGIAVAAIAGFPDHVVDAAKARAALFEHELETAPLV